MTSTYYLRYEIRLGHENLFLMVNHGHIIEQD